MKNDTIRYSSIPYITGPMIAAQQARASLDSARTSADNARTTIRIRNEVPATVPSSGRIYAGIDTGPRSAPKSRSEPWFWSTAAEPRSYEVSALTAKVPELERATYNSTLADYRRQLEEHLLHAIVSAVWIGDETPFDDMADVACPPAMKAANVVSTMHAQRLRYPYLATPYTKLATNSSGGFHMTNAGLAAKDAAAWVAYFAERGLSVDSPIVTAHAACLSQSYRDATGETQSLEHSLDPLDGQFWSGWCRPRMERADCIIVPPMLGRSESSGVLAEIEWFDNHDKPVFIIENPVDY